MEKRKSPGREGRRGEKGRLNEEEFPGSKGRGSQPPAPRRPN